MPTSEKTTPQQGLGLIHYYYGNGCGKTSIGLGHILRALGHNLSVCLVQFLKKHDPLEQKGFYYGEYITLTKQLHVPVFQYGTPNFFRSALDIPEDIRSLIRKGWACTSRDMETGKYQLMVLDELPHAIELQILSIQEVIEGINNRHTGVEIIITGRNPIPALKEIADYITHLEEIRHPFQQGIMARPGIEY